MQEPAKERKCLMGDILERVQRLSLIYCGKLLEAAIKSCFFLTWCGVTCCIGLFSKDMNFWQLIGVEFIILEVCKINHLASLLKNKLFAE